MFNPRKICFTILFFAMGNAFAVICPSNKICNCSENVFGFQIYCEINDSYIHIQFHPNKLTMVTCFNSKWSDFDLRNLTNQVTREMRFYMCDLPNNSSLKKITEMLGATHIQYLTFSSYKNVIFFKRLHLKGFRNLYYLDLSHNNISYVDQDLVDNLTRLKSLDLGNNNLRNVTSLFKHISQLENLNLQNNILQLIEPGTFDNLKNLTILSLKENNLTDLPPGIFDEMIQLKYLDLRSNNLVNLPENIFGKLKNLEMLNLAENNFTFLSRNLLQNNTNLQSIDLTFNQKQLNTLPSKFFSNLTNLKTLQLKNNMLTSLPEDLLWGCFSLTTLILSENYLDDLPEIIFRDLTNLTELKIDSNKFKILPNISYLDNLQKLNASNNNIYSIAEHTFFVLNELEELNMAQNSLTQFSDMTFAFNCRLKIINFSNNYLTLNQKSHYYVENKGVQSLFASCKLLEELYLANNRISNLFIDWNLFSNLQKIDLKHNYISNLSIENLRFESKNIEVDLRYNNIKHILNINDAEEFLKSDESYRAVILIDNNPLYCDCEIYDFLRYLEGKMDPTVTRHLNIIPGNLTCQSPKEVRNTKVTELRSESLMCEIKTSVFASMCEKCECNRKPAQNTFILNCTHQNFTSMPNITRKLLGFKKIELDFCNNRLTHIPNLTEFGPVSKLILSFNKISEITLEGVSETIEILKLNDNNISKIPSDVLNVMKNATNLTMLTLHKNPWICDCSTTNFLDFIHMKRKIIVDLQNVTCYGNNTPISNMTMIDFCSDMNNSQKQLHGGQSNSIWLFFLVFIISISGLLCYIYLHAYVQLRFTTFKRKLFGHRSILENEIYAEKLYDAFISYSYDDHDFVMKELVRKLENGLTPLKLCLPYRDWQVGEWTTANILKSMQSSRHVMVVLSPSFLESIWEKTEFRFALCQALCTDQSDVTLILYDDIGFSDEYLLLDAVLKTYIDANAYIKWSDPWFWKKLGQFLQHNFKLSANHNEFVLQSSL